MEAVYKCDYCGREFDTATYAMKCEDGHIPIETIYHAEWPWGSERSLYANQIIIKYLDGHLERYVNVGGEE